VLYDLPISAADREAPRYAILSTLSARRKVQKLLHFVLVAFTTSAVCGYRVPSVEVPRAIVASLCGWNPVCCFYFRDEGQGYARSVFPLPTDAGTSACRKAET
jgi:hypothetical protein